MTWPVSNGVFELGDFEVERGGVIKDAKLVWQSHGTLNQSKDNLIVYPCSYTADHDGISWLIGPDGILNPDDWFILIADMFSNGLSSSAADVHNFPPVITMYDNVNAQYRLVTEHFGVKRIAAAYGFSMGAGQAYHWAAGYPDIIEKAVVVCGSARTSIHNRVFLSGLLRTLEAAPEYQGQGRFSSQPMSTLKAFGHIYAGWGLSQDFYREELFKTALGAPDLETFLQTNWEDSFSAHQAANLYSQAVTWQEADISSHPSYQGNLSKALSAISAKVLLLPSQSDLYFRVADNELELPHLRKGELVTIPSIWGHRAGSPLGIPQDLDFLKGAVHRFLNS